MSILIKGMDMPENCDACMFSVWSNLSQTASCKLKEYEPCFADFSNEYRSKRADFCPLVALPDKHGRLVDADNIYTVDEYNILTVKMEFTEDDAPTIVEAEDG